MKSSPKTKVTMWNRNFICILMTSFMLGVAHFSVNPLVASYALFLGASATIMGVLTGLFFGVSLSMRPVTGPVMTSFDKRKLAIGIFALGGVVNIGYALFQNIPAFIAFRFLHGVQYAIVGSLLMAMAGDSLPKEKMASGMGIYGLAGSVGMAIGPTAGIVLLDLGTNLKSEAFGFTLVFLFAMAVLLLAVIPSFIITPTTRSEEDKKNTAIWYKNIVSVPTLPITLIMFLVFIGWSMYNVYVVEYAKELGIEGISAFYTVLAAVLIFTRPASGWLTDHFGLARVIIPAMILFAISFIIVGVSKTLTPMLVASAIAAVGFGSFQPAMFSMAMLVETPARRSVSSNTVFIGLDLGLFLGPIIGSALFQMFNMANMFKSASIIIIVGLIVFIFFYPAYNRRCAQLEMIG